MAKKKKIIMVGGGEWASELAKAFGEDPRMSFDITLHVNPREPVTVTIKRFVDANNEEIIEVIKKVVWVEVEDEDEGDG